MGVEVVNRNSRRLLRAAREGWVRGHWGGRRRRKTLIILLSTHNTPPSPPLQSNDYIEIITILT